jgi:hypothetical protein
MIDAVVEGAMCEVKIMDLISTDSVAINFARKYRDLSIISSIEMGGGLGLEKASPKKYIFTIFKLHFIFLKNNSL